MEHPLQGLDRWVGDRRRSAEPPDGRCGSAKYGFAQIGLVGFDGQIELEALRLYGLSEAAPALLCGTPALPVGTREFQASTRFVELDATAWTSNTVRVMARNISPSATFDLVAVMLLVQVTKQRIP